ncbi:MAG TPA: hypothetical protein VFW34_08935 [Candidatus Rubrimentiphilum sp.]|nr:hypothetical protein [Candidatus Rubrimentiphilum sp.]
MLRILLAALTTAIPLTAFAQTLPPSPAPTMAPSSSPSPQPSPAVSPTAAPTSVPTPLPTPLILPPQAPPQILAISMSQQVYHSGDMFYAKVITSTNVPAVELRVIGKVVRFTRLDFGIWELNYKLPHIPRRFLKDYSAQIVAMNTVNVYVARDITLSLR